VTWENGGPHSGEPPIPDKDEPTGSSPARPTNHPVTSGNAGYRVCRSSPIGWIPCQNPSLAELGYQFHSRWKVTPSWASPSRWSGRRSRCWERSGLPIPPLAAAPAPSGTTAVLSWETLVGGSCYWRLLLSVDVAWRQGLGIVRSCLGRRARVLPGVNMRQARTPAIMWVSMPMTLWKTVLAPHHRAFPRPSSG
jgi:hypothetical protein